jgi:hypothetical protein
MAARPEPSPTETEAAMWEYNMRAVRVYQERLALTLRKQILWEPETATDAEVRAITAKLIRETAANNRRYWVQPLAALTSTSSTR